MSITIIHPQFVPGVQYERNKRTFDFRLLSFTFALDLDTDELADVVNEIMDEISQARETAQQLAARFDTRLVPYSIPQLLSLLSEQHILTEGLMAVPAKRGNSLFHEVRAHYQSQLAISLSKEEGVLKFQEERLSADDLKAWSIEYYFTTRFAEQCLVTASNHRSNSNLQQLFEDFFVDEVGHDKLLERSLIGFGYTEAGINALIPHISTVAAMGMLLQSSIFDLPFFITLVGQMEGSESQSRRYIRLLENSGLSQDVIRPQIMHEMININNNHFGEALDMAAALPSVCEGDIVRCKRLLGLYLAIRASVYAHVFQNIPENRAIFAGLLKNAWGLYSENIKKAVLPITVANACEPLARRCARELVSMRKIKPIDWDSKDKQQVAAALIEYALWKTAYQEPASVSPSFQWLDDVSQGKASSAEKVPLYLVQALAG